MASAATQLSDKYLVSDEMHFDNYNKISTDKQVVYAIDSNNTGYSNGQVVIDTTNQLGGNNGFAALKESYVIAPYVVSLTNVAGATGVALSSTSPNAYSFCLKQNVANIVDHIDVQLNGKVITAGNAYQNFYNNVRLQYESSSSYIQKMAGTNMMYIDDSMPSWSGSASSTGTGFINNNVNMNITPNYLANSVTVPWQFNSGAFKRLLINNPTGSSQTFSWPSQTTAHAAANCTANAKSFWIPGSTSAPAANSTVLVGTWIFICKLQLVDLHPVFQTLDLVQNPQLRLTLYFNVGTAIITPTVSNSIFALGATNMTGGQTCPIMLTSTASNNPNVNLIANSANTYSLRVAFGVVSNSDTNPSSSLPFTTTRLYIPFYNLLPEITRSILDKPVEKKVFNDVFVQQFTNAATTWGQNFTLTVQSTFPNIQYIALLGYANPSGNANVQQFQSLLDSAPATTQAGLGLYNVQVQVGSQNLYRNLISYDFQQFQDEISNILAVNGGNTRDLGNGLIDEQKWSSYYKTWIFDCSRISSDVRQNVNITAQLQSDMATDFYVMIVYRRSFDLNRVTCEVSNQVN